MKKTLRAILLLLVLGVALLSGCATENTSDSSTPPPMQVQSDDPISNALNAKYSLNNTTIKLTDGKLLQDATAQSPKSTLSIWDKPVAGDVTGDKLDDAALIIEQNISDKIFFYVTVDMTRIYPEGDKGNAGTNCILLGENIKPQKISISNGEVLVKYIDAMGSDITRKFIVTDLVLLEKK